jgi:hypothetical protein
MFREIGILRISYFILSLSLGLSMLGSLRCLALAIGAATAFGIVNPSSYLANVHVRIGSWDMVLMGPTKSSVRSVQCQSCFPIFRALADRISNSFPPETLRPALAGIVSTYAML